MNRSCCDFQCQADPFVHSSKRQSRMNSPFPDDLINAANEDVAAAIPSLIDAAVASFDADRDTSRHYLLRASAYSIEHIDRDFSAAQ
jgi:hypothetical protein